MYLYSVIITHLFDKFTYPHCLIVN